MFLRDAGLEARISASFGIASYPDHALTPEGLIQKADQAMYRVKERDKNGIEVAVRNLRRRDGANSSYEERRNAFMQSSILRRETH